jgi:hypothetical protein
MKAYSLKFGVPFRQRLKSFFKFGFIGLELCPGRGTISSNNKQTLERRRRSTFLNFRREISLHGEGRSCAFALPAPFRQSAPSALAFVPNKISLHAFSPSRAAARMHRPRNSSPDSDSAIRAR